MESVNTSAMHTRRLCSKTLKYFEISKIIIITLHTKIPNLNNDVLWVKTDSTIAKNTAQNVQKQASDRGMLCDEIYLTINK